MRCWLGAVAMTSGSVERRGRAGAQAGTAAIVYPKTRTVDLVETQFGIPVADPYRWLENDVRTDPRGEGLGRRRECRHQLASCRRLPLRDWFKQRMTALYDYERFGLPVKKAGHYFYTHNSGLQNQAVLFVRDGSMAGPRQLIDPERLVGGRRDRARRMDAERGRQAACSTRSRTAAPTGARSR